MPLASFVTESPLHQQCMPFYPISCAFRWPSHHLRGSSIIITGVKSGCLPKSASCKYTSYQRWDAGRREVKGSSLIVIIAKALGHQLPLTSEVLVHFGPFSCRLNTSHLGTHKFLRSNNQSWPSWSSLMLVLVVILYLSVFSFIWAKHVVTASPPSLRSKRNISNNACGPCLYNYSNPMVLFWYYRLRRLLSYPKPLNILPT